MPTPHNGRTRGLLIPLLALLVAASIQAREAPAFDDPFVVQTVHGTFRVPRTFAPIEEWKTMRIEAQATHYFVVRLPAEYVAERIDRYAPELNFVRQDVVVAVEALTPRRREALRTAPAELCWVAPHDTEPRSVPYERCEYRARFADDTLAVKFWLNGENTECRTAIGALVEVLLMDWRTPARSAR